MAWYAGAFQLVGEKCVVPQEDDVQDGENEGPPTEVPLQEGELSPGQRAGHAWQGYEEQDQHQAEAKDTWAVKMKKQRVT